MITIVLELMIKYVWHTCLLFDVRKWLVYVLYKIKLCVFGVRLRDCFPGVEVAYGYML